MFKEFDFNEKPKKVISVINGLNLPDDYLAFISKHNGGEGPLGENNYGRFYKIEDLEAINEEYDVQNSWPGYVVIGGIDDVLWAYNPKKKVVYTTFFNNIFLKFVKRIYYFLMYVN